MHGFIKEVSLKLPTIQQPHSVEMLSVYRKWKQCALWFNWEMFSIGFQIWTLGSQSVRLFREVLEPLEGRLLLEVVHSRKQCLTADSFAPLPVLCLCFLCMEENVITRLPTPVARPYQSLQTLFLWNNRQNSLFSSLWCLRKQLTQFIKGVFMFECAIVLFTKAKVWNQPKCPQWSWLSIQLPLELTKTQAAGHSSKGFSYLDYLKKKTYPKSGQHLLQADQLKGHRRRNLLLFAWLPLLFFGKFIYLVAAVNIKLQHIQYFSVG